MKRKISRRSFLKVTAALGAATAMSACGGSASSTAVSSSAAASSQGAAATPVEEVKPCNLTVTGADVPMTQFAQDEILSAAQQVGVEDAWTVSFDGIDDSIAEQGYAVTVSGNTISVKGGDEHGLMYGGLEVAEQIALYGVEGVKDASAAPYVLNRGFVLNCPLDMRSPAYCTPGDAGQNNIETMWDMEYWQTLFDQMARNRCNLFFLKNLNPYPSMVVVEGYEDVALNDVWKSNVGTDAHNAINNILAAKGADPGRMTGSGNAALASKWTNTTFDKTTYSVSSVTGNTITNQFDDVDLNKYDGDNGQDITYLSRSDWAGTWPSSISLQITEQMWKDGLSHDEADRQAIIENMKNLYWSDVTSMPIMETDNGLTAAMFTEKDISDPDWDKLVQQASYGEMTNLIYNGFHQTTAVPSMSLPGTLDENGPQGFTMTLTGGSSAMAYTSEDVMAATFNRELIESMGKCIGEDFLHASGDDGTVYAGIYGPGANIHRTPYCGRNFEYFSEDGWLSGEVAAVEVAAIQNRGVYVFTKHFALNDQEEGRYGISTWSNEQAIRELYLEGFEGSVVKGGGMGVMSSFNRIGVTWSGAHRGLMTGILRDEWGMKGAAITDCSIFASFMDYRMGLLAGQDLWDGLSMRMATLDGLENDPAIVSACQTAVKRIAYSITHSHAMNVGNATIVPITPWWQMALYCATGVFGLLTAICAVVLIVTRKRAKQ